MILPLLLWIGLTNSRLFCYIVIEVVLFEVVTVCVILIIIEGWR